MHTFVSESFTYIKIHIFQLHKYNVWDIQREWEGDGLFAYLVCILFFLTELRSMKPDLHYVHWNKIRTTESENMCVWDHWLWSFVCAYVVTVCVICVHVNDIHIFFQIALFRSCCIQCWCIRSLIHTFTHSLNVFHWHKDTYAPCV